MAFCFKFLSRFEREYSRVPGFRTLNYRPNRIVDGHCGFYISANIYIKQNIRYIE